MAYKPYLMRPISHMLDTSVTSLHQNVGYAGWGIQNLTMQQRSMQKRWGYTEDRDLGEYVNVQQVLIHQTVSGTRSTVFLTDTDAIKRESAGTWSYITEENTTGTIDSITTTAVVGTDTKWTDDGIAAGDYFIMDDDHSSTAEPDSHWVRIASVADNTHLTLDDSYTKNGTDYTIRMSYTTPTNERWSYDIVNGKLCFTNGNTNVQYWDGSGKAAALDATYATKAKYCIEYANRLLLGDLYDSGTRNPLLVRTSKEGDPTNWTDSTAADYDLLRTEGFIQGFGRVGANLVIYKTDSIVIGNRTGVATDPIAFSRNKPGVGCVAPHSIVEVLGTNVFLGRDDFYIISGDTPISIGERIRYEFLNLVNASEIRYVFGYLNALQNEVRWLATDKDDNRIVFVWNFKVKEWYYYIYHDDMLCGGRGLI